MYIRCILTICILFNSVNPDCGSLLELLSRYRADDHVELLPFHGCDENKMATVQCAEQILRERNNVQMAYLIGGRFCGKTLSSFYSVLLY